VVESLRKNATVRLIEGDLTMLQVLDAACGDGFLASSFTRKGAHVTCLDISERRITQLKNTLSPELVNNMQFCIGDIQNMCELSDNTFDIVACCEIIEHVPRPCRLLEEIIRVTKPSGRIILSAPNRYALDLLLREIPRDIGLARRKVQPYFGNDNEYLEDNEIADLSQKLPGSFSEHLREYTSFELIKLIKRFGLQVERLDGTAPPVYPFCKSKEIFRLFSRIYSKIPYFNFYFGQTSVILAQKVKH
jgi:ubiquinone/menaquinone biosynthesis C-methylase UbiE